MRQMTDEWLDKMAERLDKADRNADPWNYEGSVASAKEILKDDPYVVIAFLMDNLEAYMA